MKTIAQQLNITDFPFEIKDKNGHLIYCEYSDNTWWRREYDSDGRERFYEDSDGHWWRNEYDLDGKIRYYENSDGIIIDNRPKEIIEVNGVKYQRIKE